MNPLVKWIGGTTLALLVLLGSALVAGRALEALAQALALGVQVRHHGLSGVGAHHGAGGGQGMGFGPVSC